VWAGEVLVVFGGIDDEGEEDGTLSAETWLYEPASGEDPPVVSEGIVGDWELVDGTLDGEPFPFPHAGRGTLSADDRRIGGTAFCNGYGSPYRLDGDRLRLDELGQTLMACVDGDRMAAEAAFMGVLGAEGTRFTRTAESLTLENDRGSLVFRPQTPVPTADLVGTRWVLDTLVDGEGASSTVGEPAVLQLADDGTFTAGTGSRTLSGRWQASGDTVMLDYGWAGPACPPDVDAQEQHVIAVLGNGFRAEIDGDRLTVSSSNGPGLVYRAG
jgi:heat shock protein HslJ